jgi:hypothetical protein
LWVFFWRRGVRAHDRYTPPATYLPRDGALFRVAALACAAFVAGILAGVPLALVSCLCATLLLVAFAARARGRLRWTLAPWRLPAFVSGLFLVVPTVSRHGLSAVLGELVSTDPGALGVLRAAGTGAGLANLINNLPPTWWVRPPRRRHARRQARLSSMVAIDTGYQVRADSRWPQRHPARRRGTWEAPDHRSRRCQVARRAAGEQ